MRFKRTPSRSTHAVSTATLHPEDASKLPRWLRFPLLLLMNWSLSSLLYSLTSAYTSKDLASVCRSLNEWSEVVGLLAWRTFELASAWILDYDGYDLASLTAVAHLPTLYLLVTFYAIHPFTAIISLLIDIASVSVPFRLLKPVAPQHDRNSSDERVSNRNIINDIQSQVFVAVLAAGVYGTIIFGSYGTWLPVHLATHFDGLRDLSAVYSASLSAIALGLLPVGYATSEFLFIPSTGAAMSSKTIRTISLSPATSNIDETIVHTLRGHSKRTKVLVYRTLVLSIMTGVSTCLQLYATIEGVEIWGAVGWASVWATGSIITGLGYWWVGNIEGVYK